MSKPPKGAFGAVVQGLADRQAYAEQLKANARAGRPLVAPPPAPKAAATAPPPLFSTPAKAFGLGDDDSGVMDLPPPPDDPSDRRAHRRWLMDVQRVGIAAAKPGTAAHTGAIKLYGELQAQYAAAALAAAAPPEIDAAEAEAQLRELALGLPAAVLEEFAVAYLDAHPALWAGRCARRGGEPGGGDRRRGTFPLRDEERQRVLARFDGHVAHAPALGAGLVHDFAATHELARVAFGPKCGDGKTLA